MKNQFNKGGRPASDDAVRRMYIVSTRLDNARYCRLQSLARASGQQPAEIIRQLIDRG